MEAQEQKVSIRDLIPSFMELGIDNEEEILSLGKWYIIGLIQYSRSQVNLNKRQIEKFERNIKLLQKLQERAEDKPALPTYRPSTWFNPKDLVVVYDGDKFLCGEVVPGHRHLEGMVSVWMDDYCSPKVFGLADARLLQSWELDYLCLPEHREYTELWVDEGGRDTFPGYDSRQFMLALEREHEAQATEK